MNKSKKIKITATYKCRRCVGKICTAEISLCTIGEVKFTTPTSCVQGLMPDVARWELADIRN